jgi:gluconolactonase
MYAAPPVLQTTVYARLPESLHRTGKPTAWLAARRATMHSFLEGPSFDREGNLYCVDLSRSAKIALHRLC